MFASAGGRSIMGWVALRKSSRLRKWSWSFCQYVVYFSALITLSVTVAITPSRPSPSRTAWKSSGLSVSLHSDDVAVPVHQLQRHHVVDEESVPVGGAADPAHRGETTHRDVVVVADDGEPEPAGGQPLVQLRRDLPAWTFTVMADSSSSIEPDSFSVTSIEPPPARTRSLLEWPLLRTTSVSPSCLTSFSTRTTSSVVRGR